MFSDFKYFFIDYAIPVLEALWIFLSDDSTSDWYFVERILDTFKGKKMLITRLKNLVYFLS